MNSIWRRRLAVLFAVVMLFSMMTVSAFSEPEDEPPAEPETEETAPPEDTSPESGSEPGEEEPAADGDADGADPKDGTENPEEVRDEQQEADPQEEEEADSADTSEGTDDPEEEQDPAEEVTSEEGKTPEEADDPDEDKTTEGTDDPEEDKTPAEEEKTPEQEEAAGQEQEGDADGDDAPQAEDEETEEPFDLEEAYLYYVSLGTDEEKEAYLLTLTEEQRALLLQYIQMKEAAEPAPVAGNAEQPQAEGEGEVPAEEPTEEGAVTEVIIQVENLSGGELMMGSEVRFYSELIGFEDPEHVTYQWQTSSDMEHWENVKDATEDSLYVTIDETTAYVYWRLIVNGK